MWKKFRKNSLKFFITVSLICLRTTLIAQAIETFSLPAGFRINAMQEYKEDLYFCGVILDTQMHLEYASIIKWNGNAFCTIAKSSLDSNRIYYHEVPGCMIVYNGELFVGGGFDSIDGVRVNNIARWDGSQWHSAGMGVVDTLKNDSMNVQIANFCVYNNELYVIGHFNKAGNVPVSNIARWNGINWLNVGEGLYSAKKLSWAYNNIVYQNKLYVLGNFDSAGRVSAHDIAQWDGIQWGRLGNGISGNANLTVYKGLLCTATYLLNTANPDGIQAWDGQKWDTTILIPFPYLISANTLFTYNSKLFVLGYGVYEFDESIGQWNIIPNVDSTDPIFYNPAIYQGDLYFGIYDQLLQVIKFGRVRYPGDSTPQPTYKIYPNPSTDYFTIETINPTQDMGYELYNCTGQRILTGRLSANVCCQDIHLKNVCAAGMYFIRIRDDSGWHIEKLVYVD